MSNIFKLHLASYYGYTKLFKENYNERLWIENYSTLNYCLENGCSINVKFAIFIYTTDIILINKRTLISILNIFKRYNILTSQKIEGIKNNILKTISYGKTVLIRDYVNYEYYYDEKETLRTKNLIKMNMDNFSSFYGANITLNYEFGIIDDIDLQSGSTNMYNDTENCIKGILINVDYAKRCYDKGIKNRYIMTSLMSNNPELYYEEYTKNQWNITYMYYFPKDEEWINHYIKIEGKAIYPLINNLIRIKKKDIYINFIKYPEYNIYITAKQLNLKRVLNRYKNEKELIKIFEPLNGEFLKNPLIINKNKIVIEKIEEDPYGIKYKINKKINTIKEYIDDDICISTEEINNKLKEKTIEIKLKYLSLD